MMKAIGIALIVLGCGSWVLAEDAAAPPAPTAMVRFVACGRFPAMFFKLDGQDVETKSVDDQATPYGRFHADLLYNRPYKVRFEPSDDPYSFAKSGDRMIRIQTVGSNGKEGKLPAPEPAMILAMPLPSTPFYFRNPLSTEPHNRGYSTLPISHRHLQAFGCRDAIPNVPLFLWFCT